MRHRYTLAAFMAAGIGVLASCSSSDDVFPGAAAGHAGAGGNHTGGSAGTGGRAGTGGGATGGSMGTGGGAGSATGGSMGDGGNLGTGGTGVDAGGDDASQGSGGAGGAHDAGSDATGSGGASGGDGSVDGGGAGGSSGSDGSVGGSSGGADGGAVRDGSADASDGKGGGAADAAADVKVPFVLTSTAFKDNQPIPAKYTCEGKTAGDGVSPPLSWTAGPSGTMSYAIVFADKANGGTKLHWIIWDIPAATTSLPEALPLQAQLSNPAGAQQWGLSNQKGYFGPCPGGNTHPYEFDLYALDVAKLGLTAGTGTSLASVVTAIKNHDLATAPLHCTSDAAAN